jgi:23S rRNA (pseudouridine1915-N3)-methyltransferase
MVVGKTSDASLRNLEENYAQRLSHYVNFEKIELPDVKNASSFNLEQLKEKEGQAILAKVLKEDYLVLLDDKGDQFTSMNFSKWLQSKFLSSGKRISFCVGGAFGFSNEVYQRANARISLSKMTFSHQMVRMIFLEQLYRAFTILKGEKYHHE